MGALAIKLAGDVFFGDSILQKCTPHGSGNYTALPHDLLNALKMTFFELFPSFLNRPESFEFKWGVAQDSIAQVCKRLRKKT